MMHHLRLTALLCLLATATSAWSEARLWVEKDTIYVGEIDTSVKHIDLVVTVRNTGNTELRIDKVMTDCLCTTATFDKTPVASGETGTIKVGIDIDTLYTGRSEKSILIFSNAKGIKQKVVLIYNLASIASRHNRQKE
ncbi:MAG: DUF1573 domain-containing protein [Bacteroidales bacterium]|nr:DUF1573 domain-containing protein [Bacteroidales bacterium]